MLELLGDGNLLKIDVLNCDLPEIQPNCLFSPMAKESSPEEDSDDLVNVDESRWLPASTLPVISTPLTVESPHFSSSPCASASAGETILVEGRFTY